jgi:hypothetical protein
MNPVSGKRNTYYLKPDSGQIDGCPEFPPDQDSQLSGMPVGATFGREWKHARGRGIPDYGSRFTQKL